MDRIQAPSLQHHQTELDVSRTPSAFFSLPRATYPTTSIDDPEKVLSCSILYTSVHYTWIPTSDSLFIDFPSSSSDQHHLINPFPKFMILALEPSLWNLGFGLDERW